MSKRFFDTEKFNKPWYRKLTLLQKVIWEYLLSTCDFAGLIEKFDLELMAFQIGVDEIKKSDLDFLKDKIEFIKEDIIFIPKFLNFQYSTLYPKRNKVHSSVLKKLKSYNINASLFIQVVTDNENIEDKKDFSTLSMGHTCPIDRAKDKEKDKDNDKETDKDSSSFASFLLKSYPQSFKDEFELEKYKSLSYVSQNDYDLNKLYQLILSENPHKDFAPSAKFIKSLLPRAKIEHSIQTPKLTPQERELADQKAKQLFSKYGKNRLAKEK